MILIGQYDSPFVRRVGIALRLYGLPFEHKPWSTFADADKIRPYNPLTRVPTLVLVDGEVLIESHIIIDYLDGLMPEAERLFPGREPERHRALKIAALAMGCADKAVSLFLERALHQQASDMWIDRCRLQVGNVLAELEQTRPTDSGDSWFGGRIGHADIAVAVALRFIGDAHPGLIAMTHYPKLAADAARLEALPEFREVSQVFIPPA